MAISVVINTYNAQAYLEQVLESLKDFDQIVVCDMYSLDRTPDIAREHSCTLIRHPYCGGICEPARNAAIAAARGPWVLVVDADELIPDTLRKALYALIESPRPPEGLYIPRKNHFHGRFMHATYPDYVLRFFRKDAVFWPSYLHAVPSIRGRTEYLDKRNRDLAIVHLEEKSAFGRLRKHILYKRNDTKHKYGNYSALRLLSGCVARFIKYYFIKGGWKDGRAGLEYALLFSYYRYRIYRK